MTHERFEISDLTKVEGHAKLTVEIEERKVKEVILEIFESSRFFETILRSRKCDEVASIVSRICGICNIIHCIVSLKAIENALDIQPSQQTIDLRNLLIIAGHIYSHVTHLYFMSLPDYLGYESALAMVSKRKKDIKRAFMLQKNATDIIILIAGRATHPITLQIGRFTTVPTKEKLEIILKKLKEMKDDAIKTAEIFANVEIPKFKRKTLYLALTKEKDYPLYDGKISSLDGVEFSANDYQKFLKEEIKEYSTAKHVLFNGKTFMVGALARLNINHKYLSEDAKKLLEQADVKLPNFNPFLNNFAQALEIVHFLDKGSEIVNNLLATNLKIEKVEIKPKESDGIGVGEAPRGILYHHYSIDKDGFIKSANIITPTAQNLANLEEDVKELLPNLLSLPKDKVILELEKLIRAYDPCISCATHFLEVDFI